MHSYILQVYIAVVSLCRLHTDAIVLYGDIYLYYCIIVHFFGYNKKLKKNIFLYYISHLRQQCHNTTVSQLKISDLLGEAFKGFEVL